MVAVSLVPSAATKWVTLSLEQRKLRVPWTFYIPPVSRTAHAIQQAKYAGS